MLSSIDIQFLVLGFEISEFERVVGTICFKLNLFLFEDDDKSHFKHSTSTNTSQYDRQRSISQIESLVPVLQLLGQKG